jgi:hypothetical protein
MHLVLGLEGFEGDSCVPMDGDLSAMGSQMRVASSFYLVRWRQEVEIKDEEADMTVSA